MVNQIIKSRKPLQTAAKRAIDVTLATVALLVLAPLLAVVAAVIKATSPGPILFYQTRIGLRGKPFMMIKFRSMVEHAEYLGASLINEADGPVFKMARDPRVTPFGAFMRKHSIDELPQLVNILRGEMAIVGPRPALPHEVIKYRPWHRERLQVVPGLTNFWQCSRRNDISFDEWIRMDINYVRTWTLALDALLILRTIPVLFTGHGIERSK